MKRRRGIFLIGCIFVMGSTLGLFGGLQAQEQAAKEEAPQKLNFNDDAIRWWSYKEGMAHAKKHGKSIFLLRYASWCSACQEFAEMFEEKAVVAGAKDLVMIRVDVDTKEHEPIEFPHPISIPHVSFLSSRGELLPLTAKDTSASESPYFYGDDVGKLVANMAHAARKKSARPVVGKLSFPVERESWFETVVVDTSALPTCPKGWSVQESKTELDMVCLKGIDAPGVPISSVSINIMREEDQTLGSVAFMVVSATSPRERAKLERARKEGEAWIEENNCKQVSYALSAEVTREEREKFKKLVRHDICGELNVTTIFLPGKLYTFVLSKDERYLSLLLKRINNVLAEH